MLAVAYGSLWVARPTRGVILRLDPASGRVVHRFDGLPAAIGGAAGDGAMWVSSAAGLSRIDASTNTVTATARLPQPLWAPAVGGGFVWAANEAKGETYKVDQRGTVVATYATGDGARKVDLLRRIGVGHQPGRRDRDPDRRGDRRAQQRRDAPHGRRCGRRSGAPARRGRATGAPSSRRSTRSPGRWRGSSSRSTRSIRPTPRSRATRSPSRPSRRPLRGCSTIRTPRRRRACACSRRSPRRCPRSRPTGGRTRSRSGRASGSRPRRASRSPRRASAAGSSTRWRPRSATAPRARDCSTMCSARGPTTRAARRGSAACAWTAPRWRSRSSGRRRTSSSDSRSPTSRRCPPACRTSPAARRDLPPPAAGPYYAADAINGEYMLLKRNPYYRGSRPHALDAIVLRQGIDPARAVERVAARRVGRRRARRPAAGTRGPLARRAGLPPAVLPATRFVAFNARRGPFASARVRRAAAAALARSSLAAALDLVPASGLLPPGIAATPPITPPAQPHPRSTATAVMAVEPGCDACERAYPLVRAALAGVGIARAPARGRPRRGAPPAAGVRSAADRRRARVPGPRDLPRPRADRARCRARGCPTRPSSHCAGCAGCRGTAREHAAIALAVQLAERDAPVAALGHPAIGQLLSPRLGCRVPSRFGVNLAALCLR